MRRDKRPSLTKLIPRESLLGGKVALRNAICKHLLGLKRLCSCLGPTKTTSKLPPLIQSLAASDVWKHLGWLVMPKSNEGFTVAAIVDEPLTLICSLQWSNSVCPSDLRVLHRRHVSYVCVRMHGCIRAHAKKSRHRKAEAERH